jgi:DNA polymerase sigma
MYGSMATGLAIDSSDMDLLISGIFNSKEENIHHPYYFPKFVERNEMLEQMRNLFKDL